MTARGMVQGGVVVLDETVPLPEGAIVEVRVLQPQAPNPGRDALLRFAGVVDDLPPNASETIDRVLYGSAE